MSEKCPRCNGTGTEELIISDDIPIAWWKCRCKTAKPASSPGTGDGWRPIETAPKREFVLCLLPGNVCMVLYQTDNGGGLIDTWRYSNGMQAGWPTHWMPLPLAPVAVQEREV